MKEVIEKAEAYDRLVALPAWEEVLKTGVDRMNQELFEARKYPQNPILQTHHSVRYFAMQDLISAVEGHIVSVQMERDRIIEEFKERNNVNDAASSDRN